MCEESTVDGRLRCSLRLLGTRLFLLLCEVDLNLLGEEVACERLL